MNMNIIPKMNKSLFLALLLPLLFCISCSDSPTMKEVFYYENDSVAVHIINDFTGELANDSSLSPDCIVCRQQQLKDDIYYAVSPEANFVGLYEGELAIRLFQHQHYLSTGIEASAMPRVALGPIGFQRFSYVCGGLQVCLSGHDTITALRFTDNDTLDRVWGNYVVRRIGEKQQQLLAMSSEEGSNEVWLDCPEGVALSDDTATTFTIMVPVGAFYRGFAMDVFSGDSLLYHAKTDNNCRIKRSTLHQMPEIAIP